MKNKLFCHLKISYYCHFDVHLTIEFYAVWMKLGNLLKNMDHIAIETCQLRFFQGQQRPFRLPTVSRVLITILFLQPLLNI